MGAQIFPIGQSFHSRLASLDLLDDRHGVCTVMPQSYCATGSVSVCSWRLANDEGRYMSNPPR